MARTTIERKAAMLDWMIKEIKDFYKTREIEIEDFKDMKEITNIAQRDAQFLKLYNKILEKQCTTAQNS